MSYDEDVYDYELSDNGDGDDKDGEEENKDNDEFDAKLAYLQLKRYAAKQRRSKDVSPESDYASESHYLQKDKVDANSDGKSDNNVDDDDDDDDENTAIGSVAASDDDDNVTEKSFDMCEEFNFSLLPITFAHNGLESDIEEYDDSDVDVDGGGHADDGDDNDEDFLTTTFTWNLRNKPKLQINDANAADDSFNLLKRDNEQVNVESEDKLDVDQEKSLNKFKQVSGQKQQIKSDTTEKEQKLDKLERSWPWADREKIIYKQSTCHLVPHKPLGLIEQRIQLLAKRNLLEHINKIKSPQ